MSVALSQFWKEDAKRFKVMVDDLYGTLTDKRYWYGDYDEKKMQKFRALYSLPGWSQLLDYQLDSVKDEQYLKRYGYTVADVRDPRKLSATASSARFNGYVYNFVSSNVNRLYR